MDAPGCTPEHVLDLLRSVEARFAASGRTLTFSAFANDVPGDGSGTPAIDAALLAGAGAN